MDKEHTYLVEVTFEAVVVEDQGLDTQRQELKLVTEVATFKDFNKSEAKKRAQDFFDKTLRYGLTKTGISVVKSQVPPNCIKNIAIVDWEKYLEEMETLKEFNTGLVPTDMPLVAEVADVSEEEASDELPTV